MKTPNLARIAWNFVTLFALAAFSTPALAQSLDLTKLAESVYKGTDKHRKKPCTLDVGPAERDHLNRRSQTFSVATADTDFAMTMVLEGGQDKKGPDFALGQDKVQFNISIDDKRLELVADTKDTTNVTLFRVWKKSGVGNREGIVQECKDVVKTAR